MGRVRRNLDCIAFVETLVHQHHARPPEGHPDPVKYLKFGMSVYRRQHLLCPVSDPRAGRSWRFPDSASLLDSPLELPLLPGDQLQGDGQSRADAGI